MAEMTASEVARFLGNGWAVAGFTNPYDGVSAVSVDADGMVRSAMPVGGHRFAMAMEVGGRAMNLLFPYSGGNLCAHGLVGQQRDRYGKLHGQCPCGQQPIGPNPAQEV